MADQEREVGQARNDRYERKGREIGADSLVVRSRVIDLSVARDNPVEISFAGVWLWAIDTDGVGASLNVFFNTPAGQPITFKRGLRLSGLAFQRLYITNTAQPGATMTFHASMQPLEVVNSSPEVVSTETISSLIGDSKVALGNGTPTLISAASDSKRRVKWIADEGNSNPIYIGGATASANSYGPFYAEEGDELETTAAVYAFAAVAAQNVRVLETFL
jgi:hypothetical protein